ncbi:MAG: PGPGW domain-containing protein [Nocardioides sp.]
MREKVHRVLHANPAVAVTTKIVVAVVGTLVTLVGVVMIVTPGPAFVLIPLGLAILATEFEFAQRWLHTARRKAREAKERAESVDPKVRRRRRIIAAVVVVVAIAAVVAYLLVFDWPSYVVGGWDQVQSLAGWVPDLPGM